MENKKDFLSIEKLKLYGKYHVDSKKTASFRGTEDAGIFRKIG